MRVPGILFTSLEWIDAVSAYPRVAAEYEVSWWLANDVAARAATALPVEPLPVRRLGIDETAPPAECPART